MIIMVILLHAIVWAKGEFRCVSIFGQNMAAGALLTYNN